MQWILLGVIVIALIYTSRFYPRVAFSILGVLVVAAAIIVFTTQDTAFERRQKLPVEDIAIEKAVIVPAYAGSYNFSARLVNRNESILHKESVISITMLDCTDADDDDCAVIGLTDARVTVKIPPGQARDITRNVSFGNVKPAGFTRWRYTVTETRS